MSTPVAAVRSLLITITGGKLLLPSAVVAEVLSYREADTPVEEPEWFLGILDWRHQKIPLISLEKFFGLSRQTIPEDPRLIVLYGVYQPDILPFYAFVAQDMPHSLSVKPDTLRAPKAASRAGLLAGVTVNDQTGWLPDLEKVEKAVKNAVA